MNCLIDALELSTLVDAKHHNQPVVILDCRHDLMDHAVGKLAFQSKHIPHAYFWNMESDAVAKHGMGATTGQHGGRHPLPSRQIVLETFASFGVGPKTLIVAYDDHGGQYAGRLWWLAQWIGHANIRVLDGGLTAWEKAGYAVAIGEGEPKLNITTDLQLNPSRVAWVDRNQVALLTQSRCSKIVDARAPARFRGEFEPLDPVAGHIPGAFNRFYQMNLNESGMFKDGPTLRAEFELLLQGRKGSDVVHHCGSGVTACHNIIAMEIAGLGGSALYPGSWSEWCQYRELPVAKG